MKHSRKEQTLALQDALATAEVLFSLGQSEAQAITSGFSESDSVLFAQSLCAGVLSRLWTQRLAARAKWPLRAPGVPLLKGYSGLVERLSDALNLLSNERAGFLIGQLYTGLLPSDQRKALGAYYTPPPLVTRLLELVDAARLDWGSSRVIDPACGGAAFLASVAPRLARHSPFCTPAEKLRDIEERLSGIEIDPFAAWISMVLLDIALLDLCLAANRPAEMLVRSGNALELPQPIWGTFDLVIGNPPYGRITLSPATRERFKQSLFGHANLYGVFTELGVRLARTNGIIAYVTPTSFLGGEYFKQLRSFLSRQAPLTRLDFLTDREGVFNGVLQETVLAVFRRQPEKRIGSIELCRVSATDPTQPVQAEKIGSCSVEGLAAGPWVLPRSRDQVRLVQRLEEMSQRLSDYGFSVSTGQLVWNRHKDQLRSQLDRDCFPIIWAESVNLDGTFQFQAARRGHLPYLELRKNQEFLLNHEPSILVQRTTAKEQKRRLIAAVIPNHFVVEYPGFIVENHLNMVYPVRPKPPVSLRTIAALLNSGPIDQVFRCINGSVAVSAYELNAIPLPDREQMQQLQELLCSRPAPEDIDALVASFYDLRNRDQYGATASCHPAAHHSRVAA